MTSALSNVLNQLEQLSFDELLMVQEQVNRQIRTKPAVSTSQTTAPASRRVQIPGAYTPTIEQIEASIAKLHSSLTPEELAELDKTDFTKLPVGPKSLSEMVNEDREDRF